MPMLDKMSFIARISPFDRLGEPELRRVIDTLTTGHFHTGEKLLHAGEKPDYLYIIRLGVVEELDNGETVSGYSKGGTFDARSLLKGHNSHDFIAKEETHCYLLPKQVFLETTQNNPVFAGFYYENISQKLEILLARESNQELASLMLAKICDTYIHPAVFVTADTSIRDAAITMKADKSKSLLVRRSDEVGIVTIADLREAIITRLPVDSPVGELATYTLVTLGPDDFLFNALLTMTRHNINRIVIRDHDIIYGVLEQIDLLSYLSNHSQLIAIQIERAASKQDLQRASRDLINVIHDLHAKGIKPRYMMQLVSELNKKILKKLYNLLAPPALLMNSCLLVMGSEGREEQILKTDQDNAIILRDGFQLPELDAIVQEFTASLLDFGYPKCPGNIMVSNPYWTKPLSAFKAELVQWIRFPSEESQMRFAIFFDAMPIAGDTSLFKELRDIMFGLLNDNNAFYTHFARATRAFETPLGFFTNFVVEKPRDELDIKKGGIFPIVHGIRSLALEYRLEQNNTIERIKALNQMRLFDHQFAIELIEAFAYMSALRAKAGLQKIKLEMPQDNYINPKELNTLERELLRDSFKIVNKFKELITHHFKLNRV